MKILFIVYSIFFIVVLLAYVVALGLYNKEKKRRFAAEEELLKLKAHIEYMDALNKLKSEVKKNYNAEEKSKLDSGDVHSRNSAAADILRNGKN